MTACSAPGCDQPAVLQWQRAGTVQEAQAHHGALRGVQVELARHARESAGLDVLEQRARLARVQEAADGGDPDARRLLPAARRALGEAEAREAAMTDPPDLPATLEPVTVAVFACGRHAIDADTAVSLHEPGCLSDGACGCTDLQPIGSPE